MHYLGLAFSLLASVASAIPLEENPFPGAPKWTPNHQVQPDDVIVPVKDTGKISSLVLSSK